MVGIRVLHQECTFGRVYWSILHQVVTSLIGVFDFKHQRVLVHYRINRFKSSILLPHVSSTIDEGICQSTFTASFVSKNQNYIFVDNFIKMFFVGVDQVGNGDQLLAGRLK